MEKHVNPCSEAKTFILRRWLLAGMDLGEDGSAPGEQAQEFDDEN
jgi:hypothetical protein